MAPTTRPLPPSIDRDMELKVAEQELVAGNAMRLRASSADRCALGSHTGSSRWLAFQIVTPDELFYEILMRQREQRAKFAAALVAGPGAGRSAHRSSMRSTACGR